MKPKVFIDGSEGTTGLQIHERLSKRPDIELLHIEHEKRKDASGRKKLINSADLVFFCLPDEAAGEAVSLIDNPLTRIIDASSAHRTAGGWTYGLPELSIKHKANIKAALRLANPGCHATGAVLLLAPLTANGLISPGRHLAITSLTGYTGGGKSMISEYEELPRIQRPGLNAPRLYSFSARHKHIPEIMQYARLKTQPSFLPAVADYPQGMQVIIPLHMPGKRREVFDTLSEHYRDCVNIEVTDSAPAFMPSNTHAGSDRVTLSVLGFGEQVILTAQFDNLGKGASGAAVQNMNIMLGFDEYEGLKI